jgi:hypothetical protein
MQIQCGSCGKRMDLPQSVAGKNVRCRCGQTLQVPKTQGAVAPGQQAPGQQAPGQISLGEVESYWWLRTYIKINRILGYIFLGLLIIGAFLVVLGNVQMISLLFDLPVGEFLIGLLTMIASFAAYVLVGFVYLVIWFASADFLRAVVEVAENTRKIK